MIHKQDAMLLAGTNVDLKLLTPSDLDVYYEAGFAQPDKECIYFTASDSAYSKKQITDHVHRIDLDPTRYDYLIINKHEKILGEIVLNEIAWKDCICGFRIMLFRKEYCGMGYGTQAIDILFTFAFHTLQLQRIDLEVFDYNSRAKHVYESFGFYATSREYNGLSYQGKQYDIIHMSLTNTIYHDIRRHSK